MGLYSRYILPQLLDWSMAGPEMGELRREVLAQVKGEVLEIGFGTGLNLAYYPEAVTRLTTVDVNPGMGAIARTRVAQSPIPVTQQIASSEGLPMADESFDSVVSTWTLCSIAQVDHALVEIKRVLRTGGRFFFLEHGLSSEPGVQQWQHRLNPIQQVIGGGCNLDRDIQAIVERQFGPVAIKRFVLKGYPAIAASMYQGIAVKALS